MTVVRKKRLRIKKKNFTIFIICILLIVSSITYSIKLITNAMTTKQNVEKNEKSKDTNFEKLNYYIKENNIRYQNYHKINPSLTVEQIVVEVNIGLDNNYYTNTSPSTNLNTKYILVNKYNYLSKDYVPENLTEISKQYALNNMQLVDYAKEAFEEMAKAAKKENLSIIAMSTYRSYQYQVNLYNQYVKQDGKTKADTYSGRPGYSEHQTGLAVDVYNGKESYTNFEVTKEFEWMQENAYKYGFILRFPKDKTKETGYNYESWHYRYVGREIAEYIHKNKISYEEYYVKNIAPKKD